MQGNLFDLLITFDPYLFGEFERTTASFIMNLWFYTPPWLRSEHVGLRYVERVLL